MSPSVRICLLALFVVSLVGCSGTGGLRGGSGAGAGSTAGSDSLVVEGAQGGETTGGALIRGSEFGPRASPGEPLAQRVIYFDFDQASVRQEYIPVLQAHAQWLRDHSSQVLSLEGHTDERGSREYNIALGERRAIAVRQLMQFEGVQPPQLRVLSYGEERPASAGAGESDMAKNRRVELVYLGEGR